MIYNQIQRHTNKQRIFYFQDYTERNMKNSFPLVGINIVKGSPISLLTNAYIKSHDIMARIPRLAGRNEKRMTQGENHLQSFTELRKTHSVKH